MQKNIQASIQGQYKEIKDKSNYVNVFLNSTESALCWPNEVLSQLPSICYFIYAMFTNKYKD